MAWAGGSSRQEREGAFQAGEMTCKRLQGRTRAVWLGVILMGRWGDGLGQPGRAVKDVAAEGPAAGSH